MRLLFCFFFSLLLILLEFRDFSIYRHVLANNPHHYLEFEHDAVEQAEGVSESKKTKRYKEKIRAAGFSYLRRSIETLPAVIINSAIDFVTRVRSRDTSDRSKNRIIRAAGTIGVALVMSASAWTPYGGAVYLA